MSWKNCYLFEHVLHALITTSLFVTYDVFFSDRPANCDTMVNGVCTDCANGYVLVAADGGIMACGGKQVFYVTGPGKG